MIPADGVESMASEPKVTTITTDTGLATLINVFTVDPENQRRLVQLLVDATAAEPRLYTVTWAHHA